MRGPRCSHLLLLAALAGGAQAADPAAAPPVPTEDSITAAKRQFEAIKSARAPAEQQRLDVQVQGVTAPPPQMSNDELTAFLAMQAAERFQRLYSNEGRTGAVQTINLDVQVIPHPVKVVLEAARLISSNIAHAGDTVMVEATLRPWRQPVRNIRIPVTLPARLTPGNLRLLVSDSGTLDRTLDQPRQSERSPDMDTLLAQTRRLHPADRVYISLLVPEAQAGVTGQTLTSLPLSVANALEPQRAAQEVTLNGESAELAAQAPADGFLAGFQILNLHIQPGGGLN